MLDLHVIELSWIATLHEAIRTPLLDDIVRYWDYFDSAEFLMVLVPAVWYLVGRKMGTRLFYLMILSAFLNKGLKLLFGLPRPCHLWPDLGVMHYSSPGFPSGAAQTAAILASLIIMESKDKRLWALGLLFGLSLCFSRIYLGLHFPSDILGGLVSGTCLVVFYESAFRWMEEKGTSFRGSVLLAIPVLIAFLTCFSPFAPFQQHVALTLGLGVGILLAEREGLSEIPPHPLRSVAVAFIGFFILWKAGITLFLPGFWIAYLCPKSLQLLEQKCYA